MNIYINDYNLLCSLGDGKVKCYQNLKNNISNTKEFKLVDGQSSPVCFVDGEMDDLPNEFSKFNSINNRFIQRTLSPMKASISKMKEKFGADRIAVVFGTSTSGIEESISSQRKWGDEYLKKGYNYSLQEIGSPSDFISKYLGLGPISYTLSTACSSGARAFIEGKRLLEQGLCDAVIVGGSDSLSELTLNGFHALEAISLEKTIPFSKNRKGINIGEGSGIFLLSLEKSSLKLFGVGESSDAYHISSPDPSGSGAIRAMEGALNSGNLKPKDIDYINLHGTGTIKNDEMESKAVSKIFTDVPVSSTKPLTGHTLGAAGAIEAAILCLCLENSDEFFPLHLWDGEADESLEKLNFVESTTKKDMNIGMSNSYAFGGNNVSLIIGKSNV